MPRITASRSVAGGPGASKTGIAVDIADAMGELRSCLGRCAFMARARCPKSGCNFSELLRRATEAGDYVLIHHVVSWYGVDANLEELINLKAADEAQPSISKSSA